MGAHSAIWQGYVDSSLMGSGHFDKAAILSHDCSGVEAQSPGFSISPDEIGGISKGLGDSSYALANGVTVGGDKFVTIRAADRSIYGKKGKEGIIVVKAVSCVIVAHHPESVQTTNASNAVEGLVDYINNPR